MNKKRSKEIQDEAVRTASFFRRLAYKSDKWKYYSSIANTIATFLRFRLLCPAAATQLRFYTTSALIVRVFACQKEGRDLLRKNNKGHIILPQPNFDAAAEYLSVASKALYLARERIVANERN